MGESNNVDLFDPLAIMDSDVSLASSVSEPDFAFAFNDRNFSDRVLRIEMVPDLLETKTSCDSCTSIVDWARNRKRRREDIKKDNGSLPPSLAVITCAFLCFFLLIIVCPLVFPVKPGIKKREMFFGYFFGWTCYYAFLFPFSYVSTEPLMWIWTPIYEDIINILEENYNFSN